MIHYARFQNIPLKPGFEPTRTSGARMFMKTRVLNMHCSQFSRPVSTSAVHRQESFVSPHAYRVERNITQRKLTIEGTEDTYNNCGVHGIALLSALRYIWTRRHLEKLGGRKVAGPYENLKRKG